MMSGGDTTLNLRRLTNRRRSKKSSKLAKSGLVALLIQAFLTWASPSAMALTSDSKQPMLIESDDMIYDEGKGETVYTGNVKATQGSLEVTGEKMIINQQKGESDQMIMFGKPARLKQTPDGGGPDNHGLGDRADYFPDSGILILNGNAMTWEGPLPETSEHTVKSDHIEYDTKNSIYKAGTPKSAKHRVHVRVLPKESKQPKE
ncbi:MAG TPA: lipopolysaccharide transport periplasmic protein LptA [Methylococcaceae bacterium]|jgi:lipopolysaccharide export system protein LptA|nr:lipopolysaccharide transport periplasmic protein LptA [Methylococcaceae bacterium]